MATYTPNYNLSKPELTDEYQDFLDSYGDNMDIIDNNLGGGGGGGNYYLNTIYSEEEKKVGYWTDGKPLYQKTIVNHSTDVSGAGILIDVSSLNIDSCVSIEGVCDRNVAGVGTLIYNMNSYEDSGLRTYISYSKFNQKIQYTIRFYNGETTSTQIITLRYTKTTDTADPNPQTGGVIYLPTIYSEEEREVGVWTDGKPLYQKTIPFTTDSGSNITNYTHGIANIDTVVSYSGVIVRADGVSIDINDSRWQGNADDLVGCLAGKTFISVFINYSSYRNLPIYVTILYTKTTDTAGSGTWTPSGANAVHYSTNEQVIGTWIDGKPLYEITLNPTINRGSNTLNHGIANFKECIRIFGKCKYNNTNEILPLPYVSINTQYVIACGNVTSTTYLVETGNGFSSIQDCYVTIQYTKTTDV